MLLLALVAGLAAGAATAAPRAYVGVLDDETLRWAPDRQAAWDALRRNDASVARTIVDWALVAPRRPRHAADPFDPAYRFSDLDDFIRSAQRRGIEVLLTLWGTPAWANGGAGRSAPPRDVREFGRFAHAVAARYSGRYPGLPFARFVSVWNEPNNPRFLRAADPVTAYDSLASAGVAGVRAGSPQALVAVGETSASHAPAAFMEALATRDPHLDFDAWAHHPYPARPDGSPDVAEAWPSVGVQELARFGGDVDAAFGRTNTPLWVTEYAESATAVSRARQARDLLTAVRAVTALPRVGMFVWLMLRNHSDEPWQSGLLGTPAASSFRRVAAVLDPRHPVVDLQPGERAVVLHVPALELRFGVAAGQYVTASYVVRAHGVTLASGQEPAAMGRDGWVPVGVRLPRSAETYAVSVSVDDGHGREIARTLSLMRAAAATRPAAAAAPLRRSP